MMGKRLAGQTALITGAGKRIGRETALTLADLGANIVVHYNRSADEAEVLSREVRDHGVQSWTVGADFSNPEEYESLFDRALQLAGTIDILVNNASIFPANTLETVTFNDVIRNAEVNAWVPFYLSRVFAQRVGRGKIINMLDSRITGYDWNHVAYMISKHMLTAFTNMTALMYAPGITVNAVAPGLILPPPGKDESYLDRMNNTVPLKRHGNPQDIAEAIAYLVSSDFVTGEIIFVDGGRHLWEYVSGPHPD